MVLILLIVIAFLLLTGTGLRRSRRGRRS